MNFSDFVRTKLAAGYAMGTVDQAYDRRQRPYWSKGRTAPADVRRVQKPLTKRLNPAMFGNMDSTKLNAPSDKPIVPNIA